MGEKLTKASKYFQNLLDGDMKKAACTGDKNNEIFIDLDGELFRYIMQYLRTGRIFGTDRGQLNKLKDEAAFYQCEYFALIDAKLPSCHREEYCFMNSDDLVTFLQEESANIKQEQEEGTSNGSESGVDGGYSKPKYTQVIKTFDALEIGYKCLNHVKEGVSS